MVGGGVVVMATMVCMLVQAPSRFCTQILVSVSVGVYDVPVVKMLPLVGWSSHWVNWLQLLQVMAVGVCPWQSAWVGVSMSGAGGVVQVISRGAQLPLLP